MVIPEKDLPSTAVLIDFLSRPDSYSPSVSEVECIETHGAYVFLAGPYAYKMKKPLDLGFFNFSTLRDREEDSRREVQLNKRTAPQIYLKIIPVTQEEDGTLALDGKGHPVEWLVLMRRFDNKKVLDALVQQQGIETVLDEPLISSITKQILTLHHEAKAHRDRGGPKAIEAVLKSNNDHLIELKRNFNNPPLISSLLEQSMSHLRVLESIADERREKGFVRQCHGDLHLGNIVLHEGKPLLFDCIEFNDDISIIDILYDLSFLLMDLSERGAKAPANWLLNSYLLGTPLENIEDTLRGFSLLPLFMSMRAAVRAHVTARSIESASLTSEQKSALHNSANAYFDFALDALKPPGPKLIAIGGLSGTGKSTIAKRIAPHLNSAILLRTDEIRKKLHGVETTSPLPKQYYDLKTSQNIYEAQRHWARLALNAGQSVIMDGVFAKESERAEAQELASELNLPFFGFWLDAPTDILLERVKARFGDASDADENVVRQQMAYEIGAMSWQRINAKGPSSSAESQIRSILN